MSALAGHPFAKMNGIGNEIVVVDLRDTAATLSPADARAIARAVPYDQLMVLDRPATPGTEAFVRIYNNDGSEAGACGNGMRCVARQVFAATEAAALTFETAAGLIASRRGPAPGLYTGAAVSCLTLFSTRLVRTLAMPGRRNRNASRKRL